MSRSNFEAKLAVELNVPTEITPETIEPEARWIEFSSSLYQSKIKTTVGFISALIDYNIFNHHGHATVFCTKI